MSDVSDYFFASLENRLRSNDSPLDALAAASEAVGETFGFVESPKFPRELMALYCAGVAMDEDGDWHAFHIKPFLAGNYWQGEDSIAIRKDFMPSVSDWTKSWIARPV